MTDDCLEAYGLIGRPLPPYFYLMAYLLYALPIAAGVALLAKRLTGQTSKRVCIGIISAVLWTVLLIGPLVVPSYRSRVIPLEIGSLILLLLFLSVMYDWTIQAVRSRMRPFLWDAIALLIILAIPIVGYLSYQAPQPAFCDEAQSRTD